MNITLTFVEYDAVNGLRGLTPMAFTLVSTARLSHDGDRRTWVLVGEVSAFEELRRLLGEAAGRFQRSSVATALANVAKTIDRAVDALKVATGAAPKLPGASVEPFT